MSRNSPENLLLYLTPEDEESVREVFAELAERGFPLQRQRPHITVTFAPTMDQTVVDLARDVLARAHPGREIVQVPCRSLIWQNGSLHCITMQLPEGLLKA